MTRQNYWLIHSTTWIRMCLLKLTQGDHLPKFLQFHNSMLWNVWPQSCVGTDPVGWWAAVVMLRVCWGWSLHELSPIVQGKAIMMIKHSGKEINLSTYNRNSGEQKGGEGNQTEDSSGVFKKNIGISYLFTDTANSTLNKNFVRIIPTTGISQWSLNGRK